MITLALYYRTENAGAYIYIYNVSSGYQYFFHLSEHVIQQNLSCISFSTTLKIHLKRRVVAYQTSLLTLATGVLLS